MLFTYLMLCGMILLVLPQELTARLQFTFTRLFRWPLSAGRNVSLFTRTIRPATRSVSLPTYEQMSRHAANLEQMLVVEREKVQKLAGIRHRFGIEAADLVPAGVITASIDSTRCELVIDRGSADGIGAGDYVLGDNTIVGTISLTAARTARIRLLTDPSSSTPVSMPGPQLQTVMQGVGGNRATVGLVTTDKDITVGSYVHACTRPGRLDVPMVAGKICELSPRADNPLIWDITIEPACDTESLREVVVIISRSK